MNSLEMYLENSEFLPGLHVGNKTVIVKNKGHGIDIFKIKNVIYKQ